MYKLIYTILTLKLTKYWHCFQHTQVFFLYTFLQNRSFFPIFSSSSQNSRVTLSQYSSFLFTRKCICGLQCRCFFLPSQCLFVTTSRFLFNFELWKYVNEPPNGFSSKAHRSAWFINFCNNLLRSSIGLSLQFLNSPLFVTLLVSCCCLTVTSLRRCCMGVFSLGYLVVFSFEDIWTSSCVDRKEQFWNRSVPSIN